MIHGRDGDTKDTERRGVPLRTSEGPLAVWSYCGHQKDLMLPSAEKGLAGRPRKESIYQAHGSKLHRPLIAETAHKSSKA